MGVGCCFGQRVLGPGMGGGSAWELRVMWQRSCSCCGAWPAKAACLQGSLVQHTMHAACLIRRAAPSTVQPRPSRAACCLSSCRCPPSRQALLLAASFAGPLVGTAGRLVCNGGRSACSPCRWDACQWHAGGSGIHAWSAAVALAPSPLPASLAPWAAGVPAPGVAISGCTC